jgi:hypothetical protein
MSDMKPYITNTNTKFSEIIAITLPTISVTLLVKKGSSGVPRALSPEIKRPRLEADDSPPSTANVKDAWNYTSTPRIRLHDVMLG